MAKRRVSYFGLSEEIGRYCVVALSTFLIDVLLLYVLVNYLSVHYLLAAVIAYIAATLWNYMWSIKWAFAYRRLAGNAIEPIIFWLIALAGLVSTLGLLQLFNLIGLGLLTSKFLAEGIIAVISFSAKKLILFSNLSGVSKLVRWYSDAPFMVRLHILVRYVTLPIDSLLGHIPKQSSSILEIGTGHGIVLLMLAQKHSHKPQRLAGYDIDEQKLKYGRKAAERGDVKINFYSSQQLSRDWDRVLIIDVLYLLTPAQQKQTIEKAIDALNPGGTLLVKEMAKTPAWKHWLLKTQEFISVNILRITVREAEGEMHFIDLPNLAAELDGRDFKTGLIRLDRGRLHPHLLLTAKKPSTTVKSGKVSTLTSR